MGLKVTELFEVEGWHKCIDSEKHDPSSCCLEKRWGGQEQKQGCYCSYLRKILVVWTSSGDEKNWAWSTYFQGEIGWTNWGHRKESRHVELHTWGFKHMSWGWTLSALPIYIQNQFESWANYLKNLSKKSTFMQNIIIIYPIITSLLHLCFTFLNYRLNLSSQW